LIDANAPALMFTVAALGASRVVPLRRRVDGTRHRVTTDRAIDDAALAEVYVFTGIRRVPGLLRTDRKIPVFAHVDTRPLLVSEHTNDSYLENR
jgi:hypothetical protein